MISKMIARLFPSPPRTKNDAEMACRTLVARAIETDAGRDEHCHQHTLIGCTYDGKPVGDWEVIVRPVQSFQSHKHRQRIKGVIECCNPDNDPPMPETCVNCPKRRGGTPSVARTKERDNDRTRCQPSSTEPGVYAGRMVRV